jgi:phenylacetate-CoA ligase
VAVVATLNQYGMPLIRYRLGDLCAWTDRACSCGCTLPLVHPPEGRSDDELRFPGGVVVSPLGFYRLRLEEGIERFQVIQESGELVRVLIIPSEAWQESRAAQLEEELADLVPPGVRLQVELVGRIEDTGHKFKTMVSKVKGEEPGGAGRMGC